MASPSLALSLGFWVFPPLMIALLLVAVAAVSKRAGLQPAERSRRLLGIGLAVGGFWLLGVGLAAAGLTAFGTLPPRPFLLFMAGFALTVVFARSRAGADLARHLPLWLLVGFQSFRILVELLLHRGALDGLTPPQMTYTGWNFDVVTGLAAVVVAIRLERGVLGRRAAWAFNVLGILLLANVLTIAVLSMPTPLRVFVDHPVNVWIADAPFIGLPTILVPFAMLGHMLLWKRLRDEGRQVGDVLAAAVAAGRASSNGDGSDVGLAERIKPRASATEANRNIIRNSGDQLSVH